MDETWKQFVISALRENIVLQFYDYGSQHKNCNTVSYHSLSQHLFDVHVIKIKPKKQVKLLSTLWISIVDQDEST